MSALICTVRVDLYRAAGSRPPPLVDVMAIARDDGRYVMVPIYMTAQGDWMWSLIGEPVEGVEIIAWYELPDPDDLLPKTNGGPRLVAPPLPRDQD